MRKAARDSIVNGETGETGVTGTIGETGVTGVTGVTGKLRVTYFNRPDILAGFPLHQGESRENP